MDETKNKGKGHMHNIGEQCTLCVLFTIVFGYNKMYSVNHLIRSMDQLIFTSVYKK